SGSATVPAEATQQQWFGHPRGLSTLFFTELWERFSYYGMRALLILFMTDLVANHGLGMDVVKATAIYGLYTFGVYALALPGGWIADHLVGQRKAVLYGGIIIAAGHYVLAVPATWSFFLGLLLVVLGTGLLKPNVSAIVGDLYPEGGARRDAGFSIFYMGINLGALFGPLICSYLGEDVNWHLGFGAAGVGMTFGLLQYVFGAKHLRGAGELKEEYRSTEHQQKAWRNFYYGLGTVVVLILAIVGLSSGGILPLTLVGFAQSTGIIVIVLSILYFAYAIFFACHNATERKRVAVIFALFIGAAMFWSGFEQAGSSMNLFTENQVNRVVMGWEAPTGWLQSINPLFIILLAPVVGGLWVKLGSRNPSLGYKFAMGLILLGVGFFVMAWASTFTEAGKVSPMWLVATYFFHTVGELCLSPVGLSAVTKLSPPRLVGQMMGTWFMGAALGNLVAGLVAGLIDEMPQHLLFGTVASIVVGVGIIFLIFAIPIRKLSSGIN
ncbi:MAG: peptide MFS transporter, partial [bacterium]|nr:peptide MFS transporter [bacterium]